MSIKTWLRGKIQELVNTDGNVVSYRRGVDEEYRGNEYNTYSAAVTSINNKYNGTDQWGVLITGSIIDVRAAFTIPAGLEIIPTGKSEDIEKEMAFSQEFFTYNGFDNDMPFEYAKESEIEAKVALLNFMDKEHIWKVNDKDFTGMVKIRYLPWTTYNYTIETAQNDYLDYEKLVYTPKTDGQSEQKTVTVKKPRFTYRRFGGRIDQPNDPSMKIWKCLTQIEFIDQALRDWREIDRLFASPTPYFKTETENEAKRLMSQLEHMNWKIKKILASTADFSFVGFDISSIDSLKEEIIALAKFISGSTGVPVHFLGLPDLLSNRATANNLMELVWASTVKEREVWNSAYTEVLSKAIDLWNENSNGQTKLRNDVLRVEVQEVKPEQWEHLEKVYMPMLLANKLSLEYVLSQIPNLDLEEELQRQEMTEEKEIEKTKLEMERREQEIKMMKNNPDNPLNQNNINNKNKEEGKNVNSNNKPGA